MDRSIIDAASGGALVDMTPFEARSLIEKMASNSQQFNARCGDAIVVRGVHDVGTNVARQDKLETEIDSLTTLITQLAINQQKSSMARVCGICTSSDHYSDMCPSLLEPRTGDHPEAVFDFAHLFAFLRIHCEDIFGTKDIFGHYKWKVCAKVKIVFSYRIFNSVLALEKDILVFTLFGAVLGFSSSSSSCIFGFASSSMEG
ncbi:hypothetical protein Lal_00015267 [Lupinus albus]|nr:hypothetical protein Lal_00015267 [Lupinus albus]